MIIHYEVLFSYTLGIYNEDSTFIDINVVWVFEEILVFDTIWVYIQSIKPFTSSLNGVNTV